MQGIDGGVELAINILGLRRKAAWRRRLLPEFTHGFARQQRVAQTALDAAFAVEQIDERDKRQAQDHAGKTPERARRDAKLDADRQRRPLRLRNAQSRRVNPGRSGYET